MATVTQHILTQYVVKSDMDWMTVALNSVTGEVLLHSSFFNGAHFWRSIGTNTLEQFLIHSSFDYAMGKLATNVKDVLWVKATVDAIIVAIEEALDVEGSTPNKENAFQEAFDLVVDEYPDAYDDDDELERLAQKRADDLYDEAMIQHKTRMAGYRKEIEACVNTVDDVHNIVENLGETQAIWAYGLYNNTQIHGHFVMGPPEWLGGRFKDQLWDPFIEHLRTLNH